MGVRQIIVADILLNARNFLKYYLTPITDIGSLRVATPPPKENGAFFSIGEGGGGRYD